MEFEDFKHLFSMKLIIMISCLMFGCASNKVNRPGKYADNTGKCAICELDKQHKVKVVKIK